MEPKEKEIILFYNSDKQRDKEVLGYSKSLKDHTLNEKNLAKTNLTERQIAEIAQKMKVSIEDLLDKNEEIYLSQLKEGSFSDEELLKVMTNNQELIKTPIAYMDDKAFFVESQYSFVNKDIEVEGVKSEKGNEFEK